MKGKIASRILVMMLGCVLMLEAVSVVEAADKVIPSSKEYEVDFDSANTTFLGNEKGVQLSEGEAVYLTYTVKNVELKGEANYIQQGIIATQNKEAVYPYDKEGLMDYGMENVLLKEGYTYFLKFQVTEFGFECAAAYTNGQDEDYISFPNRVGEIMADMKYAGIWFAGKTVTGRLTHVHCYDQHGNDLGIATNNVKINNGTTTYDPEKMKANSNVKHHYEFFIEDAPYVAISNARGTKANVVYMEYTVQNVKNKSTQTGVEMTNSPTSIHPHGGELGYLKYQEILDGKGSALAIEGATYLVRFEREESGFDALVQYSLNGTTKYLSFSQTYGLYRPSYEYFTLWFGEGEANTLTAKFTNFKCYDDEGNNLGVQTNKGVEIVHYGGLEDYSKCEAVYYCKENDTFITLDDEQKITKHVNDAHESVSGTYSVDGTKLIMKLAGESETEYIYYYRYMQDPDGNKYIRLKESKVKFVQGKETETRIAYAKDGFKVQQPDAPSSKNGTFKAWCLSDGTEYDFNQVVMENTTLYAKWIDGDGNEYLATDGAATGYKIGPVFAISAAGILIAITVLGIIFITRSGKKNEKKQDK